MGNNKVDKGFELLYWKLSYRRKFIRTLWLMPIGIIISANIFNRGNLLFINRIIPISIVLANLIQLSYNFNKWKEEEN